MLFDRNRKLNNLTMKHILVIITYTIALLWIIMHVEIVSSVISLILDLLSPFIYGIAIAFIFHIPYSFYYHHLPIKKDKVRKVVAVITTIITFIIFITAIIWIVVPVLIENIISFVNELPSYIESINDLINRIVNEQWLSQELLNDINDSILSLQKTTIEALKNGLPQILSVAKSFASSLANVFMSLVVSVYVLISKKKLIRGMKLVLKAFLNKKQETFVIKVAKLTNQTFHNFISGQLVEAVIIGVLCYLGCIILSFPYAPIVSVVIGCTNIIPIFGAIVGVVIGALLVAIVNPIQGLLFIIFGICLQQFESNIIYPRVVGNSVGLSGLWVLFAITIGGGLWGFVGMIIGLPLFSIIYTLFREIMYKRIKEKEMET